MDTILGYCSTKLAKYSQYDSEIIKFAMKLWLSAIGQSFVMMCIAYLFFDIKYFFYFFMAFFPLRLLIDGYHCKTFFNCFAVSTFYFVAICVLSDFAVVCEWLKFLLIYLFVVSVAVLTLKSFVKTERNKLFLFVRLGYIVAVTAFVIAHFLVDNININVHIWVTIISFSTVFILNIIRRKSKDEKSN